MKLTSDKKFGFGCMRMPTIDPKDQTSFDFEKIEALFDEFIKRGFTYFDTAYTYHGYMAEEAVRKALVERHPRDAYTLATKLPLRDFKDGEDMEKIFNEQLEHCGVDYFDFYLLHNMGKNVYEKCCKYDAFHFVAEKKKEGKILNVGMSFHDQPELLEEILEKYGDCLDFLQLQINYVDMENTAVRGRECLEIANRYNLPVAVMEPCKGGTLVNLPEEAQALLKEYDEKTSAASYALRFAASQKGVFMVLSGMNDISQVVDNTDTFTDFKPLNEEEEKLVAKVGEIIDRATAIPCTGCEYCTHDCPKGIAIPQYFSLYNSVMRLTGSFSSQAVYYNNTAVNNGKASDCIGCGQCEKACPQHLPIREYLKDVEDKFEANSPIPKRK